MSELDYPAGPAVHRRARVGATGEDDVVRVGITSFAQDALGDVVYVTLPAVGDTLSAGDSCGEVESTKSRQRPLRARCRARSSPSTRPSTRTPELVNTDPYGEGWMFELRLADAGALDALLDVEAYRAQLG